MVFREGARLGSCLVFLCSLIAHDDGSWLSSRLRVEGLAQLRRQPELRLAHGMRSGRGGALLRRVHVFNPLGGHRADCSRTAGACALAWKPGPSYELPPTEEARCRRTDFDG